jgi:hypothetical protein
MVKLFYGKRPQLALQTSFEFRSQGSTLHWPKGDQQQSPLGSPMPFRQHFRFLTKQQQRKIATEINPASDLVFSHLRPILQ